MRLLSSALAEGGKGTGSGQGLKGMRLRQLIGEHQSAQHRERFGVDQIWRLQVGVGQASPGCAVEQQSIHEHRGIHHDHQRSARLAASLSS